MRGRLFLLIAAICAALAIAGCGDDDSSTTSDTTAAEAPAEDAPAETDTATKPKVSVPDGAPPKKLVTEDLVVGDGAEAKAGDLVSVDYVGVAYKDGKEFDTSWGKEPLEFQLGAGSVIPGWDQGIEGMKVGGRREIVIPPDLAYGPQGFPPVIAPEATLVFVVDLRGVK